MTVIEDRLRSLLQAAPKSADHLLDLLSNGLDWPIPGGLSWDDTHLEWEPEELHLDPEKVAKLKQISQIPPLTKKQKFGVFVLEFDGGGLPVGAIRRLVQRLVKNQRAQKTGGKHAQWALDDLLFFCLAKGQERLLHVVNFRERDGKRVLRVLSWSDHLTRARLDLLVRRGAPDLAWISPEGPKIIVSHSPGAGAGFHRYREGIKSAAALSRRMAEVAQDVRDEIRALYEVETASGPIRILFTDVRDQLLSDLSPARFADVYAQTMVYGLLTARIAHPEQFKVDQSVSALKFDNEFLDAIYSRFREESDNVIDVDELGLNELAEELASTDVDELLADFGADNQRDDPVVYFYEEFLAQYDPDQRRDLGAFYTPLPVVRYIVKTVDDAIKSFGLALGVADPTSWAEYVKNHPGVEVPKLASPHQPFVSMFDPANGTGTFLVEWIRQARRNAGEMGEEAALTHASACEISLASYAVSHLKVSLEISEQLRDKSLRLPIYLGDTLGARHPHVFEELADPISTEGARADEVKFNWNHNVIIGNPPYDRVESTGTGGFVTDPQEGSGRSLFDDIFDDARQNTMFSHHASLYNLYVYFWRWAIWKGLEVNTGPGVISMITGSSWLTGPGFIGLRRLVREVADEIIVTDLGGDNKGSRKDENVFNIESPVAIVTLLRRGSGDRTKQATVRYARVWGTRSEKLSTLAEAAVSGELDFTTVGGSWFDRLVPETGGADWLNYAPLINLFPWQSPGCKFNRTWPIAPTSALLEERWDGLLAAENEEERARCFVTPSSGRNIWSRAGDSERIADLPVGAPIPKVTRYGYRSFDRQFCIADPRVAALERPPLWASLSDRQVFLTTLTTKVLGGGPACVPSAYVPDLDYFSGRGGKDVIPLYRDASGTPNGDPKLLAYLTDIHRQHDPDAAVVTVERLFAYAFGVLAGTDYTARFEMELATPGPRIPLTANPKLFADMSSHGESLLGLQTFGERFSAGVRRRRSNGIRWNPEPTKLPTDKKDIKFDPLEGSISLADGILSGVSSDVWDFNISGMPVLSKWLGYRMVKPGGKAASSGSPLDKIRPTFWPHQWSDELVEIVDVIGETLSRISDGVALMEAIVAGPIISNEDLPSVPDALRTPPANSTFDSENLSLFGGEDEL